uniref:Uncharacterized protein n=1 Tax=Oryza nivara TaxID=4536 RepID=A0A0E0IR14_ORYNI
MARPAGPPPTTRWAARPTPRRARPRDASASALRWGITEKKVRDGDAPHGAISSHGYSVGPIEWWSGVGVGAQRFTEHAQLMAALGSAGRDDNTTRASHAAAAAAAATAVSSMGAGDKQMDLELHL